MLMLMRNLVIVLQVLAIVALVVALARKGEELATCQLGAIAFAGALEDARNQAYRTVCLGPGRCTLVPIAPGGPQE